MIEYPKINTYWKRGTDGKILVGEPSLEEFALIKEWEITEKIDGTNIRVGWDGEIVEFAGRTDRAEIPMPLFERLAQIFNPKTMLDCFPPVVFENGKVASRNIVLFGEGFGKKIQGVGSKYNPDGVDFILFDVHIGGLWLERDAVIDIAQKFGIRSVPILGKMTVDDAIAVVTKPYRSMCSAVPLDIEGVVARSKPLLLTRRGEPLMWKLKVADYRRLRNDAQKI